MVFTLCLVCFSMHVNYLSFLILSSLVDYTAKKKNGGKTKTPRISQITSLKKYRPLILPNMFPKNSPQTQVGDCSYYVNTNTDEVIAVSNNCHEGTIVDGLYRRKTQCLVPRSVLHAIEDMFSHILLTTFGYCFDLRCFCGVFSVLDGYTGRM